MADAVQVSDLPGATELAEAALRAAVASSGCWTKRLDDLATLEARLGTPAPGTAPVVRTAAAQLCLPH